MEIFFLCVATIFGVVFITYFGWKLIKYIAYNLSHTMVKGIYDARNGTVHEKKEMESTPVMTLHKNKTKEILSRAEEKVRKDWRWSLFTYFLGTQAISIGCYFFLLYYGDKDVANEVLVEGTAGVIGISINLAIMFYFAYVKFGTKWIGWFLFVSPIRTTLETIKDLIEIFKLPDLTTTGIYYVLIGYLLSISFYVYFWIHCKRLFELNVTIKQRKIKKEDKELELAPLV